MPAEWAAMVQGEPGRRNRAKGLQQAGLFPWETKPGVSLTQRWIAQHCRVGALVGLTRTFSRTKCLIRQDNLDDCLSIPPSRHSATIRMVTNNTLTGALDLSWRKARRCYPFRRSSGPRKK